MLPKELQERKQKLQKALAALSHGVEILRSNETVGVDGDVGIEFEQSVRVFKAGLRLNLYERFIELDTEPQLYAFSYHILRDGPAGKRTTLFRYECHPEIDDPSTKSENARFQSPYARLPHFHPDETSESTIKKLHFPFHREERRKVVFALINWLQVDLVRRFYSS